MWQLINLPLLREVILHLSNLDLAYYYSSRKLKLPHDYIWRTKHSMCFHLAAPELSLGL